MAKQYTKDGQAPGRNTKVGVPPSEVLIEPRYLRGEGYSPTYYRPGYVAGNMDTPRPVNVKNPRANHHETAYDPSARYYTANKTDEIERDKKNIRESELW
jgi:hypothetical protein